MEKERENLETKGKKSVKWSLFAEFFSKIANPLSTMVLARILTPEIFGIATAVTIVVSFCEALTESGFSRFLVQKDFKEEDTYKKSLFVSLITSLFFSSILFALILIFRTQISDYLGNNGYESILLVSCLQLPFTAFNSIFTANLKRTFKFNHMFVARVVNCLAPFIITIPLALLGFGPWSLVIGTIGGQIIQTPILIFFNRKVIKPYFSFKLFKETLALSFPMVVESFTVWVSAWLTTFIATQLFDTYTVGIVRVSSTTANSIFGVVSVAYTMVLFALLSRQKDDKDAFENTFYKIQSNGMAILIPLGIGAFFYSDLIVSIMLGSQWTSASFVIGVLSIAICIKVCFNDFVSEVFRAKGHFYFSIIYHLIALAIKFALILTVGRISFEWFIWSNVLSYLFIILFAIFVLKFKYKFSLKRQLLQPIPSLLCAIGMIPFLVIKNFGTYSLAQSFAQAICCGGVYLMLGFVLFKSLFKDTLSYLGFEKLTRKI